LLDLALQITSYEAHLFPLHVFPSHGPQTIEGIDLRSLCLRSYFLAAGFHLSSYRIIPSGFLFLGPIFFFHLQQLEALIAGHVSHPRTYFRLFQVQSALY
jgi:hypothetical protein